MASVAIAVVGSWVAFSSPAGAVDVCHGVKITVAGETLVDEGSDCGVKRP